MELKYHEYFPFPLRADRQSQRQPLDSAFRDRGATPERVERDPARGATTPPLRGQNKNDDNKTNGNSLNQKCLLRRRLSRGWVPTRDGRRRRPGDPREVRLLGHQRRRRAVPSPQGGAKRATTGSETERGGRREIWIRVRGETRYKCILLRMNSLPLGVCLCLTLNEGDERDDQRRGDRFDPAPHFAGGEASDQNRGYVHSRLITLSHLPIPFLVTSHVSLKRSTSVQLLRNGSGIF